MSGYLAKEGVDVGKTRSAYEDLAALNAKYGELATDVGLAAGGALPPPFGTAADIASLGRSLWKGDWGGALWDVVGLVPIAGDAAKAGKIGKKLVDLRRALDVAGSALGKTFGKTKKAAAKYWDDMVKAKKADYDAAIKSCKTKACRDAKAALKGPQYKNLPSDGPRGTWKGDRGDSVFTPSNGTKPITYKNGFPDFSTHTVKSPNGSNGSVEIAMKGNYGSDFTQADAAMRLKDPNFVRPANTTWHHKEDGVTMELVPTSTHNVALGGGNHVGGGSLYNGANAPGF
jgi:A nuclease of the HNH/ENDO VII superfamily with conserved WHH